MSKLNTALVIGLITRPHGIRGEVCIQYYADSPYLFKAPLFLVSPDDEILDVKVLSHKGQKESYILKIDCSNDRDQAESFRDYELCIEPPIMQEYLRRASPSTRQGKDNEEVFVYELTDCEVYTLNKENFDYLGILKYVDFMAGQEIWRIYTKENKEVLFPAVPQFVEEIDIQNKKILINPPEGLLDLYLSDDKAENDENNGNIQNSKPKKRYKKSPKQL